MNSVLVGSLCNRAGRFAPSEYRPVSIVHDNLSPHAEVAGHMGRAAELALYPR